MEFSLNSHLPILNITHPSKSHINSDNPKLFNTTEKSCLPPPPPPLKTQIQGEFSIRETKEIEIAQFSRHELKFKR
jgi:hypothetical protein